MTKDPRELPDDYLHTFSGSLGKHDQILNQYGVGIKYSLEREGNHCKVRLCYSKPIRENEDDLTTFGHTVITDVNTLTTKEFLGAIKTGIESIFDSDNY